MAISASSSAPSPWSPPCSIWPFRFGHGKEAVEANTRSLEENRKVQMAATYQARVQNMSENSRLMCSSAELAKITVRALDAGWPSLDALDSLDAVERFRFRQWSQLQYLNIENLHYQYELGLLEPDFYDGTYQAPGPGLEGIRVVGNSGPAKSPRRDRARHRGGRRLRKRSRLITGESTLTLA